MKNCYAITKICRHDAETEISLVMDDSGLQHLSFESRHEARSWIRRLIERSKYHFECNGNVPTTYEITEVGSKSFRDAYRLVRGMNW